MMIGQTYVKKVAEERRNQAFPTEEVSEGQHKFSGSIFECLSVLEIIVLIKFHTL